MANISGGGTTGLGGSDISGSGSVTPLGPQPPQPAEPDDAFVSLRIFRHLLPRARAWLLSAGKLLTEFFSGLSAPVGEDVQRAANAAYFDIFPETTTTLQSWEDEYALPANINLSEAERRERLSAAKRATGGQSPRYLQDTLRAAGFDVYAHEWWQPNVTTCTNRVPKDQFVVPVDSPQASGGAKAIRNTDNLIYYETFDNPLSVYARYDANGVRGADVSIDWVTGGTGPKGGPDLETFCSRTATEFYGATSAEGVKRSNVSGGVDVVPPVGARDVRDLAYDDSTGRLFVLYSDGPGGDRSFRSYDTTNLYGLLLDIDLSTAPGVPSDIADAAVGLEVLQNVVYVADTNGNLSNFSGDSGDFIANDTGWFNSSNVRNLSRVGNWWVMDINNTASFFKAAAVAFEDCVTTGDVPAVGEKVCVDARDPRTHLAPGGESPNIGIQCGQAIAQCGEPDAQCGNSLGTNRGYPLTGTLQVLVPNYDTQCGEAAAQCGELLAQCQQGSDFTAKIRPVPIPDDPDKWHYFVYIGALNFPDLSVVSANRRAELEALVLKLRPAQLWVGMLVTYS